MGAVAWQSESPSVSADEALERYALVAEVQEAVQNDSALPLDEVASPDQSLRQARPTDAVLGPDELGGIRHLLQTGRLLKSYFASRLARFPMCAAMTGRVQATQLERAIEKAIDPQGNIVDSASPALRAARKALTANRIKLEAEIGKHMQAAIKQGFSGDEQPTIRNGRAVLPLKVEAKRKIKGFVHDVSASGQTVFVEPADCLELNNIIAENESTIRREEWKVLSELTASVREDESEIRNTAGVVGEIDVAHAKVLFGEAVDGVIPRLLREKHLDFVDARNPHLLLREKESEAGIVPLNLRLEGDQRTLVITGPNAGGKTVAAKTVGVLFIMLSHAIPLPVDERSSLFLPDQLFVDIGDDQSVESDLSTFSSHAFHWKSILQNATEESVVVLDELGSSTDPLAGGAIGRALIEDLTGRGSTNIVTTHIGALKTLAEEDERIVNGSMQFDSEKLVPTYELKIGMPGSSFAFEILDRIGIAPGIVERARELAGDESVKLEFVLASLQQKEEELRDLVESARLEREMAQAARKKVEARESRLEEHLADRRAAALAEAEALVSRTTREMEQVIREIKEASAEKAATRTARAKVVATSRKIREDQEKLARGKKAKPVVNRSPISVGDRVRLAGQESIGEVVTIKAKDVTVVFGSIQMSTKLDQLEKVGAKPEQVARIGKIDTSGSAEVPYQLDIRGMRAREAVARLERYVDDAIGSNNTTLRILHGTGTGALRAAVHTYLESRSDVRGFGEAEWEQGGPGVTEVTLV